MNNRTHSLEYNDKNKIRDLINKLEKDWFKEL